MAQSQLTFPVHPANPFEAARAARGFDPRAAFGVARAEPVAPGEATYALVKSAPAVPADEVEIASRGEVEVTVLWGTNVLHVAHLATDRAFWIGEAMGERLPLDYLVPEEKLGVSRLPLVQPHSTGTRVAIPRGARAIVERDGSRASLDDASTEPCPEAAGARTASLPDGGRLRIEHGDFTYVVSSVRAGKPTARASAAAERGVLAAFGATLLAAASMVAAAAYFVPPLGLVADEQLDRERVVLLQQYLSQSAETEREATREDTTAAESSTAERGGTGTRASGAEGAMGKPTATTSGRWAVQKVDDDPRLARARAVEEARTFGMNALLSGAAAGPLATFGRDSASGTHDLTAEGAMWGDVLGEGRGTGGLGLTGGGFGGGGYGEGIGLGNIGTYGNGAGLGPDQGFGSAHGRLSKGHTTKGPPRIRPEGATVLSGRLPAETIQRVVRQNFGRYRMCYEQGLARNPTLAGRISVRFVIGRDGAVSNVSNGGSDLPDSAAVGCIVRAFYGLSFPQPEGGIVTVVYPLMLSPG